MRRLRADPAMVDAALEERVVWWLAALVRPCARHAAPATSLTRRTRDAVHDVERVLSERWGEAVSLSDLSRAVGLSVFHLCRAFRRLTGRTMHEYRETLRLRDSLDALQQGRRPITDIALDAGFSSHSHYTAAFRRAFGQTPSAIRAACGDHNTRP